jgi:serine protease Do
MPEQIPAQSEPKQSPPNRAGLALSELTPEQKSRLKVDHGLLVRNVTGPAQRTGIQPGDVILAINDIPVNTVSDFEAQLARSSGGTVALLVKRGAETLYVPLKLEKR